MRVWKLKASITEKRHPSRWGYALASNIEEVPELCQKASGLPFNWVRAEDPAMLRPVEGW